MDDDRRAFLEDLLTTPSPSGYEVAGQRVWVDYVSQFADDVTVDDYGNAVAVHEGTGEGPEIAFTGTRTKSATSSATSTTTASSASAPSAARTAPSRRAST